MLRYPGGKLRLMKKIDVLIKDYYPEAENSEWVAVDAFTGGGGSLINMAIDFPKWKFIINDKNEEVFKFWRFFANATIKDMEIFYNEIKITKPTLELYNKMFDFIPTTDFDSAFKILFLNKTSYSGYITQRLPIGGAKQLGNWKVDCYWTPPNLIKKIEKAYTALTGRILKVGNEDAVSLLKNESYDFIYADPPYLVYGAAWYNCEYTKVNLLQLKEVLTKKWCVSIDDSPITDSIFSEDNIKLIDITYTAKSSYSKGTIKKSKEAVIFPKENK